MIERRSDKTAFNLMQRAFDVLGHATCMLTMTELAAELRIDVRAVRGALHRLRLLRCLKAVCIDGVWRYGLRVGSERPTDRRGRPRARELRPEEDFA